MKEVQIHLNPYHSIVQMRFVVVNQKGWYDLNIQPVVDIIIDTIPQTARADDRSTCSWEIDLAYWPELHKALEDMKFRVRQVGGGGIPKQYAAELASATLFGSFCLVVPFILQFIGHFYKPFGIEAFMVRFLFSLVALASCISAALVGNYKWAMVVGLFATLFNPIIPIHLHSWVAWQFVDVIAVVTFFLCSLKTQIASEKQRDGKYWYLYGTLARRR